MEVSSYSSIRFLQGTLELCNPLGFAQDLWTNSSQFLQGSTWLPSLWCDRGFPWHRAWNGAKAFCEKMLKQQLSFEKENRNCPEPQQLARGWGRFLVKCSANYSYPQLTVMLTTEVKGSTRYTMCDCIDIGFFANTWMSKGLYEFVKIPR